MKHYEVVCAVIYDSENKIFCTQRGPGRALEGKWEFPGGKVESNETHEDTIIREIKEELDSLVEPLEYLGAFSYEYTNLAPYEDFSITLYAYKCKLVEGNLILSEHINKKWATNEDLINLDFAPADKELIKLLIR
ncbi:MAG: (deoxy)nucleoside triphosphate pyrophosphohydrolase [Bacilli bacterium]